MIGIDWKGKRGMERWRAQEMGDKAVKERWEGCLDDACIRKVKDAS